MAEDLQTAVDSVPLMLVIRVGMTKHVDEMTQEDNRKLAELHEEIRRVLGSRYMGWPVSLLMEVDPLVAMEAMVDVIKGRYPCVGDDDPDEEDTALVLVTEDQAAILADFAGRGWKIVR